LFIWLATRALPKAAGSKIIAHICNDGGAWGKGFVLALSKISPAPERAYRKWYAERNRNDFALGALQFMSVSEDVTVANMIGQHGIRTIGGIPSIHYAAVETALETVGKKLSPKTPRFICRASAAASAGGSWREIELLIERQICALDVPVFVYDLR